MSFVHIGAAYRISAQLAADRQLTPRHLRSGFCRDSLPQTGTVTLYRQVMSVVITVLPSSRTATPQSAMLYVFAAPEEV